MTKFFITPEGRARLDAARKHEAEHQARSRMVRIGDKVTLEYTGEDAKDVEEFFRERLWSHFQVDCAVRAKS